jgi:RNA polymerase sigma factor (sigma-70 family)
LVSGNKTHGGAVLIVEKGQTGAFEQTILPHMDAVDNLARRLTRNEHNAEDMVQQAYLREFKLFGGFHGAKASASVKLKGKDKLARFEQSILPHMDAAYNLARWLTRNDDDAEEMVQEAYVRAFKFFDSFRGVDGRPWLLTIVRNTCYTWLQQNRRYETTMMFDEEIHSTDSDDSNPETLMLQSADQQILRQALEELPVEFREVVVLRDLEGFSYKEIADIANIPAGTVMSRLARARERLKQLLCNRGYFAT